MEKRTKAIIIALICAFTLILILGPPNTITGFVAIDRVASFFVGNSLSSLGPITILSIIFAAAIVALHELIKKR